MDTRLTQHRGTHEFYESCAGSYDALTLEADLSVLLDEFRRRVLVGGSVLDLGCGSGRDARRLTESGYRVIGVDYAWSPLLIGTRRSGAVFVQGDMRRLPFKPRSFDCIWAVASLLHVQKTEITQVLTDLHDLVRTEGLLFVSTKIGSGERVEEDGRFFSFYDEEEWARYLRASGWIPLQIGSKRESRSSGMVVDWLLTVSRRNG